MTDELTELKKIYKVLLFANGEVLEKELSKYATTDERKRVWVLINRERQPNELAEGSGMKIAAVYNFLKILTNADLIENLYGKPPCRKLDYVPASWLELIKPESEERKQEGEKKPNEPTK